MSAGIGGSKGSSNTSSNQQSNSTGTYTPSNLPFLQTGWNTAGSILAPTSGTTPNLAATGVNSIAGQVNPTTSAANTGLTFGSGFASGNYADNPANAYLTPYANGSFVNSSNPQFQGVVSQISNALQPQIDGSFAANGRYGSGANANAFASALTNETGNLSYQNYLQQQANQLAAAGQLSTNNSTGRTQQLQGLSLLPGLTTNAFTPGTAALTGAYAPLLAYISAIAAGNGGGTTNQQGTSSGTSNTDTTNLSAGVGTGGAMGSRPA